MLGVAMKLTATQLKDRINELRAKAGLHMLPFFGTSAGTLRVILTQAERGHFADAPRAPVIEVRLLAYTHLTDKTAVLSFASQEVDMHGNVESTWILRTTIVTDGVPGSSLIAEQHVKTADLRPMLAKTSTRYGLLSDKTAALSLIRSL